MYNIIKGTKIIDTVDRLQYVRKQPNGVVINCDAADAQGICAGDAFYHLPWLPVFPGAEDVTIEEFSGAAALAAIEEALNE